jgi:hypothetical protein
MNMKHSISIYCLLVIDLNSAPVVIAGHAFIVTEEDIVGAGVSLEAPKTVACAASAAAGVTPTPPMCITSEFQPDSGEPRSQYQRRSNLSGYACYFAH